MDMRYAALFVSVLLVALSVDAKDSPLDHVAEGLSTIAGDTKPVASVRQEGRGVTLSYNARTFMVHSSDKQGRRSGEAHRTVGPRHDGLIVRVSVQDGPYAGAAKIPQDLSRPYWTTFVNAYSIAKGTQHLHVNILYGSRTAPGLIKSVKELLNSVKAKAWDPSQTVKDFFLAAKEADLHTIRDSVTQDFWEKKGKEIETDLKNRGRGDSELLQHLKRIDIIDKQIADGTASIRYEIIFLDPDEGSVKSLMKSDEGKTAGRQGGRSA
ncbi:MAG: hypothetical protein HN919_18380 [Verrucomicrobia bacterium]|nr:hypothetical protein [Verrucomicrobiota bacterium]MBT7068270.1 hypothetical protein [Verrucomicrobiota bacterium]MBT7702499.1 hypothetical protein [Verrucomicrobiota bacterium]